MTKIQLFAENFYILDDGRVRQFLILGEDEALLIDTGFEDSNVYHTVKNITQLPVKVIMTHGDPDHAGGLKAFGKCYLHKGDWPLISEDIQLEPLKEGDIFKCGDYTLEAIEIPGHTYGSTAFADWEKKLLLPGDSVQKAGPIYMFGKHRNLDLYIESQRKLLDLQDKIETILPCHHESPIDPGFIEKNLLDAEALRRGDLEGEKHPLIPCYSYKGKWTEFYYDNPTIERTTMNIRQAQEKDVSRIAEILVYNNRVNFFSLFLRTKTILLGSFRSCP